LIHYPIPAYMQAAYCELGIRRDDLEVSDSVHDRVLSLPIGPHMSKDQHSYVVKTVREALW
jgi:dTDP-4-amino-4,6-dideoxygalactose transaminase